MSILTIILVIAAIGVILWLINQYVPMEASIKKLLNIVVIVFLIIWLLRALGLFNYLSELKV